MLLRQSPILLFRKRLGKCHASTRHHPHTFGQNFFHSLALTVRFLQPDLGMTEPEILSRGTAYLLSVDGSTVKDSSSNNDTHSHLQASELRRAERKYKQLRGRSPVAGEGRNLVQLGWLEYVPREVRPAVHVVCSSHVVAPFLWRDYYPQPWLDKVRQEHCCEYVVEVYEATNHVGEHQPDEPIASFALHPEPLHHPEGKDIALMHLKNEKRILSELQDLGVQIHQLRDPDNLFQKGEKVTFEGYVIDETGTIDGSETDGNAEQQADYDEAAARAFQGYQDHGTLAFHTEDRFFAPTNSQPLPGGMCGAPVLDSHGTVCGTVEGIVPVDHANSKLAGTAAFLPSYAMQAFVDYVERGIVEKMMPSDLFSMVQTAKKTNSIGGGIFRRDDEGNYTVDTTLEEEYDKTLARLKEKYSVEEYEEIMESVRKERDEVMGEMNKKGGDLDKIIERVHAKRLQIQSLVQDQVSKKQLDE